MFCQKQNNIDLPEIEIITFRQNTDILPKKSICSSFQIFQTLHFLLNITEPSFDIASLTVDNPSKSTEGENQGILIDDGKKEK